MQIEDFYKKVLDNIADGVYFVNRDGKITYWNKAAENITGYRKEEVLNKKCSDNVLMHVDDQGNSLCLSSCPLKQVISDGIPRAAEVYLHHKEGFRLPVAVRVAAIRDDERTIVGAVELFSDNSLKVADIQKIKELEGLVYTDHLTGLVNRKYIEIIINSRLEEIRRYDWPFGVLFLDLDNFKHVNDTYGHDIGDRVLKMAAQTLIKNCRTFDVVGRWGGEEFVCVIANINRDNLFSIADKFRRLLAQSSLLFNKSIISITASIGAVLADRQDTLEDIIQRADKLQYQSKISGRNCVTLDWGLF